MPELRVLALTPDYPPDTGGIQIVAHRVLRHSSRLRVRIVAPRSNGASAFDAGEPLDVARVDGAALPQKARMALLNAAAVREGLRFEPDVILSFHIVTSPAAVAIKRATGAPIAQYLHADELSTRPGLARFALRNADAAIAVSRHTRELALAAGAEPGRLHRIPNGVDLPNPPRRAPSARPTLLTVARLRDRYKGHDVLVRALPLIRARVRDARWVVLGDGPLREHIERLAAAHQVARHATFLGLLPDTERDEWLARAHVFTMPSRLRPGGVGGEGFGIAYLEASAHGLPVVAGNVGGALDAVVHGETGLLVDPTDHVAVADAIADLLLDPQRAEALGRAGRERAERFNWPRIAREVEEVLLGVAADRA